MNRMIKMMICASLMAISIVSFAQDFEVAPVIMDFQSNPGGVEVRKLTVTNHENKKQSYTFVLSDFNMDANGKQQRLEAGRSQYSLASWVNISPSMITLNPNEQGAVDVIITVPISGTQTKWGMISVQPVEENTGFDADKEMSTGVKLKPRIGVIITQSPKNSKNWKGKVVEVIESTEPKMKFRKFDVKVTNTGEKILDSKISLRAINIETRKEYKLGMSKGKVFPGGGKVFSIPSTKELPSGKYVLTAILNYGHRTKLEGKQIIIEQK